MAGLGYTVVSTMKNEGPYIIDWVAHYKTLGFDHVLVCTNDCSDPTVEILRRLQDLGFCTQHNTIVRRAGIHRSALNQASRRYDIAKEADWLFVCDVDEYLNIHVGDGKARDLVAASGDGSDVISVPWRVFGTNGVEDFKDLPVQSQFRMGELAYDPVKRPKTGKFVKSFYRNQYKFKRMGLHAPVAREDLVGDIKWVLPGGEDYVINAQRTSAPPVWDLAQVNHYALRSKQSFLIKRARGRANHSHHVLGIDYWKRFELNGELDTSIDRYQSESYALAAELKTDPILKNLHEEAVKWHSRKAQSIFSDPEMDSLRDTLVATG